MNRKLKKGLQVAFEPPTPTRKREFLNAIPQTKISNISFLRFQSMYIPKYVWGIFGLVFGIALVGGCFLEKNVLWIVSALIPFVALCVITENARSDVYLMSELEMTARFSLKSVLLARMAILGLSHMLLLIFLIPVCAIYNSMSIFQTGLYLLLPYVLTTTIGLWAVRKTHGMESMYLCMGIAIGISEMNLFAQRIFPVIYEMRYISIWLIALIVLIILFTKEMRKNIKRTEELAWNLF